LTAGEGGSTISQMPLRLAAAVCLLATLPGTLQAQAPALDVVLGRAASYVDAFHKQLSGIVAEEDYLQQVIPGGRRSTTSDLVLVRPAGFDRWLQFRDIIEVNGQPVRNRQDRLTALLLQPAETAMEQARRIAIESARENFGPLLRTINVPVMPLIVLEAANQKRFKFTRAAGDQRRQSGMSDLPATPTFRVQTEVWIVRFDERQRPTIIRDDRHRNVESVGRFWIEPGTGRVLMSEMIAEHPDVRAHILVSYQSEPVLGLLVPIEMRETYTNKHWDDLYKPTAWPWQRIEATATYGRFRQFQVRTNEQFKPIQ
jgi:hypothetical protein